MFNWMKQSVSLWRDCIIHMHAHTSSYQQHCQYSSKNFSKNIFKWDEFCSIFHGCTVVCNEMVNSNMFFFTFSVCFSSHVSRVWQLAIDDVCSRKKRCRLARARRPHQIQINQSKCSSFCAVGPIRNNGRATTTQRQDKDKTVDTARSNEERSLWCCCLHKEKQENKNFRLSALIYRFKRFREHLEYRSIRARQQCWGSSPR